MSVKIHIGTSGWHYEHWRGVFYPEKLSSKAWLKYYTGYFNTVEINASFYRLPLESTFDSWRQSAPPDFCFAVKASRFITHIKRIKDVREPLQNFITRAEYLKDKLGPILYQLPPGLHRDDARLEAFLNTLDNRLKHVLEFRHESWMDESVFKILRKYNAGFCIYDMPKLTSPVVATASFAYMRFHGKGELYYGNYPDTDLSEWADHLFRLAERLDDLYIYFNNDAGGYAITNAQTIQKSLGKKQFATLRRAR